MFNLSGSEIVIILLLALVVLGPEKLPEAIRRFGRVYGELRRMSTGFQTEFRSAFEEPLRELKETADLTRRAVQDATADVPDSEPGSSTEPVSESESDSSSSLEEGSTSTDHSQSSGIEPE